MSIENPRTDMALEANELFSRSGGNISALKGIRSRREAYGDIELHTLEILDSEGSAALNKPQGKYYTMELKGRFERGAELFPQAAAWLSLLIKNCIGKSRGKSFLIAALGNPDITPDALGSIAASNIIVTRHLKESLPGDFSGFSDTMLCRTGVLGTTGMESAMQIKCIADDFKPDCIIAVDALAGSEVSRLCRTVQVCDTGISPGSGVGNNRAELSLGALGVPVVAVGVPTVIDASSFAGDELLSSMFVTPRDIDSAVRSAGRLIGYGINMALHPGLTVSDIDMLLG